MIAIFVQAILAIILYYAGSNVYHDIQGPRGLRAGRDAVMIATGLWSPNEDSNALIGDIGLPADGFPPAGPSTPQPSVLTTVANLETPGILKKGVTYLGVTAGWNGPYIGITVNAESSAKDPWQTPWNIMPDGTVQSAGPDGIFGTADDIYGSNSYSCGSVNPAGPIQAGSTGTLVVFVYDTMGRLLLPPPQPPNVAPPAPGTVLQTPPVQVWVSNPDTSAGTTSMVLMYDSTVPSTNYQTAKTPYYWVFPGPGSGQPGLTPGQHAVEVIAQSGTCDGSDMYVQSYAPNQKACVTYSQCSGANQQCLNNVCTQVFGNTSPYVKGGTCTNLYGHGIAYVIGGGASVLSIRLH
jgi:hypothetical protein